ncbi:MAG TPA: hypothetical protein VF602_05425 [Pedobacter sp.]|jgi:hypothetical protein
MDATDHLRALGEETLNIETIYLDLKIEKELSGDTFHKDSLLNEAEALWKEIDAEYHAFLHFLQSGIKAA